jgi:regulator of sigma E protease
MGSNMISAFLNGDYTQWVIPFLFVLTIIVLFHELGHYVVARLCGVRVTVFSLGFGKELLGFTDRHGTRWKISAIPLGGYVKFFGDENETSVPNPATLAAMTEEERRQSFPGQPVGNRAMVAAAGPIVNFILAIAIFAGVFMAIGKPTAINSRIGSVVENSPAAAAGIKAGDLVVSIDGTPVSKFDEVARIVGENPGAPLTIVVDRNGALTTLKATPAEKDKGGKLGIGSSNDDADMKYEPVTPAEAVQLGAQRTWFVISTTLTAIHDIVLGKQSAAQLGGPIMIAQLSGKVAQRGLDVLLGFTAMLSASVGLFNLFPIPILDGGHLLLCLVEAVRGKPLSERALEYSFRVGLVLIGTLFVFVIFNDLHRVWTGAGL